MSLQEGNRRCVPLRTRMRFLCRLKFFYPLALRYKQSWTGSCSGICLCTIGLDPSVARPFFLAAIESFRLRALNTTDLPRASLSQYKDFKFSFVPLRECLGWTKVHPSCLLLLFDLVLSGVHVTIECALGYIDQTRPQAKLMPRTPASRRLADEHAIVAIGAVFEAVGAVQAHVLPILAAVVDPEFLTRVQRLGCPNGHVGVGDAGGSVAIF